MKHVSILMPKGIVVVDTIISSFNLFQMANSYYKQQNGEPLLEIDLVADTNEAVSYQNGLIQVQPSKSIDQVESTDLVILGAIAGSIDDAVSNNEAIINWLKVQRIEKGAEIASLCRGAVLLAETGLLNGKDCSTHWFIHDEFKARYPKVNLVPESIISEDNGLYSSGGAYSFLNFIIYMIERFYGREIAIWCSKMSEIEFDRISQGQFTIFNGQKEHSDEEIKQAQEFIESNYDKKISIDELAKQFNISSRNFLRRFKKATYNTPLEYLQRVRIEVAKKKLESTVMNVQEVMFSLGYNDDKSFRTVFKKYTGITPAEYRSKYNREMAMS